MGQGITRFNEAALPSLYVSDTPAARRTLEFFTAHNHDLKTTQMSDTRHRCVWLERAGKARIVVAEMM